jgi:hypothetical protein
MSSAELEDTYRRTLCILWDYAYSCRHFRFKTRIYIWKKCHAFCCRSLSVHIRTQNVVQVALSLWRGSVLGGVAHKKISVKWTSLYNANQWENWCNCVLSQNILPHIESYLCCDVGLLITDYSRVVVFTIYCSYDDSPNVITWLMVYSCPLYFANYCVCCI